MVWGLKHPVLIDEKKQCEHIQHKMSTEQYGCIEFSFEYEISPQGKGQRDSQGRAKQQNRIGLAELA